MTLSDTKIFNFKSEPKMTPFAPEWDYYIIESMIQGVDFGHVANIILSKEKQIIEETKEEYNHANETYYIRPFDGYTGLGPKSLTSRSNFYNLLTWNDPEIDKIKTSIVELHDTLLKQLRLPLFPKLYIQCWANVMRKGEKIKPHLHSVLPMCYLGGHICVKATNTSTHYVNHFDQANNPQKYSVKNDVGKLTIFQNHLTHYTDRHNDDNERISIAFDLFLHPPEDKTILKLR